MSKKMNKEEALNLLRKNMSDENLLKHSYAVGFAMAGIYRYLKDNNMLSSDSEILTEEDFEVVGILHDSDYEITKDNWEKHTFLTLEWLKELGIEEDSFLYKALMSHNNKITHLREPETQLEWALECVDELTGFIVATALIRPEKDLASLKLKSIKKKWKQPAFAKGVIREQTEQVNEKLGIDFDTFVTITLKAMQDNHEELGL